MPRQRRKLRDYCRKRRERSLPGAVRAGGEEVEVGPVEEVEVGPVEEPDPEAGQLAADPPQEEEGEVLAMNILYLLFMLSCRRRAKSCYRGKSVAPKGK